MIVAGISEDLAKVQGIDFRKYNLIYLLSIALPGALGDEDHAGTDARCISRYSCLHRQKYEQKSHPIFLWWIN